jgi:hypothetical protein
MVAVLVLTLLFQVDFEAEKVGQTDLNWFPTIRFLLLSFVFKTKAGQRTW